MDWGSGETFTGPLTLKNYPLPVDKVPLFVGGPGMLLWQPLPSGPVEAWVFPLSPRGTERNFFLPDGQQVTVTNEVSDWMKPVQVIHKTQTSNLSLEPTTRSVRFPVGAGGSFVLTNAP